MQLKSQISLKWTLLKPARLKLLSLGWWEIHLLLVPVKFRLACLAYFGSILYVCIANINKNFIIFLNEIIFEIFNVISSNERLLHINAGSANVSSVHDELVELTKKPSHKHTSRFKVHSVWRLQYEKYVLVNTVIVTTRVNAVTIQVQEAPNLHSEISPQNQFYTSSKVEVSSSIDRLKLRVLFILQQYHSLIQLNVLKEGSILHDLFSEQRCVHIQYS